MVMGRERGVLWEVPRAPGVGRSCETLVGRENSGAAWRGGGVRKEGVGVEKGEVEGRERRVATRIAKEWRSMARGRGAEWEKSVVRNGCC